MPMNPHEKKIATILGATFRHWRREQYGVFAATALAALLLWLLAAVLIDNLAMLPVYGLIAFWVVLLLAAAGWGGLLLHRLTVGRPAAIRLALLFESRVPGQQNRLVNAVEFIGSRQARNNPLAQAAVIENADSLHLSATNHVADFRLARRALLISGIVAALFLTYAALRPPWVGNALMRLLQPISPQPHLLATEPLVSPGNVELIEGQPLLVSTTIRTTPDRGGMDRVTLEYNLPDLGWSTVLMHRDRPGRPYEYEFTSVRHPFTYRIRAGRSASPTYTVKVQPRPSVQSLQLTVTPPEYAGGAPRRLKPNIGDVTALAGSRVDIEATASVPLSRAHLELRDGRPVPMRVDSADATLAQAALRLSGSDSYAVRLTDHGNLTNINPPRYTLTATPDQSPLAIVTAPGRDLILPLNTTMEIHIEAQDDIGLANVVLQTRGPVGDWSVTKEWPIDEGAKRLYKAAMDIDLSTIGVAVGDTLLYRAIATDRRIPEPNTGPGRTWSITIAEPEDNQALLAAQTRYLLEAIQNILALQRENRAALDMDRAVPPMRTRQENVRNLTAALIAEHARAIRPQQSILDELIALADGPMLEASRQLADFGGSYAERFKQKRPLLAVMNDIITRLEALVGRLEQALNQAEKAQEVLEQLADADREQALQNIRDILSKLREFVPEQDKVIADTEELVRRADDLTDDDLETLERLKGTEDKWAEIFLESVKDISKLTEQGFADETIANDYKEMVEQIEAASLNLTPDLIELAVPREQSGRELAESLVEEMEMWLPNSPDNIQWIMEEPLDFPEIPMVDLPDQLWDLVGDLIEDQDELNDAAEDVTSAWADSIAEGAGWEVAGGPISNFSAVGKTGNQLPDDNELSGRSGDGRSGRSQGQLVEDVAKGLAGRNTPTRITNDPYEEGVVKELQQLATSGATGGGKARGAGQEGLQGESPPPLMADMQFMKDWQQRIRQKAERVAGQLKMIQITLPDLNEAIELMKNAEQDAQDARYTDMFETQRMVLQRLRRSGELASREINLTIDRAYQLSPDQRRKMLDSLDEPIPDEYQSAVQRYFQQLSESP
ncbi:MAG: hypothetical protein JXO22_16945 [Phycisphaerae bacterium]|nr:hypothetical protein [Phycisphaerae bacterium]